MIFWKAIIEDDFDDFDLILAMDRSHHRHLASMAPEGAAHKIAMFLEFAPKLGVSDVPDPYYGAADGFEETRIRYLIRKRANIIPVVLSPAE